MWPCISQAFTSISAPIPFNPQICNDFHCGWAPPLLTSCFLPTTAILFIWDQIHSFDKVTVCQLCITCAKLWGSSRRYTRDESATDLALKGIYIRIRELRLIWRTTIAGKRWYVPYKNTDQGWVLCRQKSLPGMTGQLLNYCPQL